MSMNFPLHSGQHKRDYEAGNEEDVRRRERQMVKKEKEHGELGAGVQRKIIEG